ncbi:MAG: C-terminal binding protein [Isosphaeraceae bacterium]
MKIVVTDYSFSSLEIEEKLLEAQGHEVVGWKERRPAAELIPLVADADAVITQFAPVDATVIAAMERARVIVRYGIGTDNVDLDAARARGIPVCNVPDYCIDEVADHTLAFLLALTRQVVPNTQRVHAGGWGLATPLDGMRTLRDLTVGLIGFGRIGREVAGRLRGFKSRILVFDPGVEASVVAAAGCEPVPLETLLETADLVSLHCPSTPRTRGLIGTEALARMKPGALLVNVARGDLVDPGALVAALDSGRLAGAALDVFAPEPIPAGHPILGRQRRARLAHRLGQRASRDDLAGDGRPDRRARPFGETLPNVVNGVG